MRPVAHLCGVPGHRPAITTVAVHTQARPIDEELDLRHPMVVTGISRDVHTTRNRGVIAGIGDGDRGGGVPFLDLIGADIAAGVGIGNIRNVYRPGIAALVGGDVVTNPLVDSQTPGLQGMGLGVSAVVLQWAQHGIAREIGAASVVLNERVGRSDNTTIVGTILPTTAVGDDRIGEVHQRIGNGTGDVHPTPYGAGTVSADCTESKPHCASIVEEATAILVRCIAADGTVFHGQGAYRVVNSAPSNTDLTRTCARTISLGQVAADSTLDDGQRTIVNDTPAVSSRDIVGNGAAFHSQRAGLPVDNTATVATPGTAGIGIRIVVSHSAVGEGQ